MDQSLSTPESFASNSPAPELLSGSVDRVTYHNEQNGYTVLRLHLPGHKEPVTVTGSFSSVSPGESLRLRGFWTSHPQYGDQFKAISYEVTRPATISGIQKYLGSGLIKGIGPVTAKRIVDHFGTDTLEIIENDISRLVEVRGVSRKRVDMIRNAWEQQRVIKEVMLFLQSHSVSTHLAVKIFKTYENDSIEVVEKTPYRLAAEVYGIGFRTADRIARNMGVAADSEERLRAGLQYVLSAASDQGHCYLPGWELIEEAARALEVEDTARLNSVLEQLIKEGLLKAEDLDADRAVYLPPLWQAERSIARRLGLLLASEIESDPARIDNWLSRYSEKAGIELSTEQRSAVARAARERVFVITGGPGTGKTFTLKSLVALFKAMGKKVRLASPTGRAAQRLSEVAGEEARTVHRLLEFDPSSMGFKRNEESPFDADVVIVDEASMLDVLLMNNLLKAMSSHSQIIFVGDVDQLPSVGPGSVLRDMIDSGMVPAARLTQIFRQAARSLIVQNAHRINHGEFPLLVKPGERICDCYFIEADEPELIAQIIIKTVSSSLPKRLSYDALRDIQVLTPMNRGAIGATDLNRALQATLNPPAPSKTEVIRGNKVFRAGDKVIQNVNNYKLEVFNGDMGTIELVDTEEQAIAVRFADRLVQYDYADALELGHGFAVSIHKSQGSEFPAVVIPLHTTHYRMLSRNLIYTALTRAKKTVVIVGTKKAIGAALNNVEAVHRYTGLKEALADLINPAGTGNGDRLSR